MLFHCFFCANTVVLIACNVANGAGLEVISFMSLDNMRKPGPETLSAYVDGQPWPIRIYTLGRFVVCRKEKQVVPDGRGQRKPFELLKALIALGGRGVEEGRLISRLWPDAEGDAAYRAFITNLQRLRQLLGRREAIQLREGCLTLNPSLVWVDCWEFERLLSQAEAAEKAGHIESAAALCSQALILYTGRFLEREAEHPWALHLGDRLHRKFRHHVERRGRCLEGNGEWENAAECYRKALDVDHLTEPFYQGLMRCYLNLGRPSDAIATYQSCRRVLAALMGIGPSAVTEALHQSCRRK